MIGCDPGRCEYRVVIGIRHRRLVDFAQVSIVIGSAGDRHDVFPYHLALGRDLEHMAMAARDAQRVAVGQALDARDVAAREAVRLNRGEIPHDLLGRPAGRHLRKILGIRILSGVGIDLEDLRPVRSCAPRAVLEDQEVAFSGQTFLDPLRVMMVKQHPIAFGGRIAVRVIARRFTGTV